MGASIPEEIDSGNNPGHPIRRLLLRCRAWVELHRRVRWIYRILVGLLGAGIVGIGLILVPLPGPGWLIVFLGLAVLGTEYPAAHRVGAFLKRILTRLWARWRNRAAATRVAREATRGTATTD
ncbi:TIGR02611 family protein [Cryobacterium algoritolerans]|uniref:TIGR02611 family protein n=1 Tax=Cryobacterium algoritolerans TaxID=1259184 RepID=A0A4R8WWA9_9MICO|nr:PGPGW domain-containing protein [Cryobacterium algoritolerans]TFC16368.1 TIGR02611 family protein [Cryobacterium algoritolerans]